MSETGASGASEGTGSAALADETSNQAAWHSKYWLISRLLATTGALLLVLSTWIPWASARMWDGTRAVYLPRPLLLDPGEIDPGDLFGVSWSFLVPLVLLIIPFLWLRPRPGWRMQPAGVIYCWAVFVLLIHTWALAAILLQPSGFYLAPELGRTYLNTDQIQILIGTWVAGLGALLAALGALMLLVGFFLPPLVTHPSAAPARTALRRRSAIGALVFGVLLFWLGTLILPWATVNCTAMPLFFGQCTGLPFNGVLADAIRVDIPGLDPLAAIYSANILLSGGALFVLIAVFRGARSHFFAFWVTVWLLLASGFVALASAGVRLAASQPAQLGLPSGSWSGDMGIFVTLLALGLGWIGAGGLWLSRQRSASA